MICSDLLNILGNKRMHTVNDVIRSYINNFDRFNEGNQFSPSKNLFIIMKFTEYETVEIFSPVSILILLYWLFCHY